MLLPLSYRKFKITTKMTEQCYFCSDETDTDMMYRVPGSEEKACPDCYQEHFEFYCPLCEESVERLEEKPENTFMYINKNGTGLESGFYKAVQFPVFIADCIGIYIEIQQENIELLRPYHDDNIDTIFCCEECASRYPYVSK